MKYSLLFILFVILILLYSCRPENDYVNLWDIDMNGKVMLAQWNIGHLNGGSRDTVSEITPDAYAAFARKYQSFLSQIPASIISINEYTHIFATDKDGVVRYSDSILFGDYDYKIIGSNNNGSCNALFSRLPLTDNCEIYFECNDTVHITHSDYLKANWYYLLESKTVICGISTIVASTHLAFDLNNDDVSRNQVKEIIERYRNDNYVILCGDWNLDNVSIYDLFLEAGYQLANHGALGDFYTVRNSILDNIIVKGFDVEKTYLKRTSLSDHHLIVTILSIK